MALFFRRSWLVSFVCGMRVQKARSEENASASQDGVGASCPAEEKKRPAGGDIALINGWKDRFAGRLALAAVLAAALPTAVLANDYPTAARADYVIGCMAANGQSYLVMQKCSCSLDVIAEALPYEQYERIETILRMREGRGELGVMFRTSRALEDEVQSFRRAQVEADLRCF